MSTWKRVIVAACVVLAATGCNEVLGIHVLPEVDAADDAALLNSVFTDGGSDGGSGVDATIAEAGGQGDAAAGGGRCVAGDLRCSPSAAAIQECDLQGIWRDTQSVCPFVCSGGGASTACTGTCKPGTASCGADGVPRVCDSTGTNQPQTPCASVCTGSGTCTGECVPATTRCTAGSTTLVETCDATGAWGAPAACTYVCDPTTNQCGGECVPGAPGQCSGNTVQTCSPAGFWTAVTVCATTPCSQGACQTCAASQKQCNAGKPQTCDAAGIWVDDQASACPFLCDATTGLCSGECVPGTSACGPGQVTTLCGANALRGAGVACANICDPGTGLCGGVCAPDAMRCNGSAAEICGADGQWGADTACAFGCDATTGTCSGCVDDALAIACAGGKCGPTPDNCGHTAQCPATCMGTGQTCGGGGVTGVCGCSPQTQAQACGSAVCGSAPDGCGGTVACGTCTAPLTCDATGQCVSTMCPVCPMGSNCGSTPVTPGCVVVNCGTCTAPQTSCNARTGPGTCLCTPLTLAQACGTNDCGSAPDGCGGTITCGGACTAPQTSCVIADAGAAGKCTCSPNTQACASAVCGSAPDGCNGMAACGTCTAPLTCDATGQCVNTMCPVCPMGSNCGSTPVTPGCVVVNCGTCAAPQTACNATTGPGTCICTPQTRAQACGANDCGSAPDGCGATIACGACTAPQTSCVLADAGTTGKCTCIPQTQAQACGSAVCGSAPDGCGGMVACGTCPINTMCDATGQCPSTCSTTCAMGANCGMLTPANGCPVFACGPATCTGTGQTCGGGGTPNVCGCTPATTCPAGQACGTAPNGCGGTITCGTCPINTTCDATGQCQSTCSTTCAMGANCGTFTPANGCPVLTCGPATCTGTGQTCGGGGTPNVCGCIPATTCPAGQACGTAPNGCGGTIQCPACGANQACNAAGQCVSTCATTCAAGTNCGTFNPANGCPIITCGPAVCTGIGQTCGGGGTPNVCGCIPATSCPAGQACGTAPNGCGGTIQCPVCGANQACNAAGQCVSTCATTCAAGTDCGTFNPANGCPVITCGPAVCTGTGQTCGGGGTPNVCGCIPATSCPAGQACGTAPNGCGGTIQCPVCGANQACNAAGQCVSTCATTCAAGTNCGTFNPANGCPVITCGPAVCAGPGQTCGGGGTSNVCGCVLGTDASCSSCGDNCTAQGGKTCQNGACACPPGEALCNGVCISTSQCVPGAPGNACEIGCNVAGACVGTGLPDPTGQGAACTPTAPSNPCDRGSTVCNGSTGACVDTGTPAASGTRCGPGSDVCDGTGICTCPNQACGSCSDKSQCFPFNGPGTVQVLCCAGNCNDVQQPCDTPPTATDPFGQCHVGVNQCVNGGVTCEATGQLEPDGTQCGQSLEEVCLGGNCVQQQYGPCTVDSDCVPGGCLQGVCLGTISNPGVVSCGFPTTCSSSEGCSGGSPVAPAPLVCGNLKTGGFVTCDATSDCAAGQDCCFEDAAAESLTQLCYPRKTAGVPGSGCPIVQPNAPVSVSLVCDPLDPTNAACPAGSACRTTGAGGGGESPFGCVCPDGSGVVRYCRDNDGDGDGDPNHQIWQCSSAPAPAGYVGSCNDCCDSDPRQFFGSSFCDSVPSLPPADPSEPTSCGTFLYSCAPNPNPGGDTIGCDLTTHTRNSLSLDCTLQGVTCTPNAAGGCDTTCSIAGGFFCEGGNGGCQWENTQVCGGTGTLVSVACSPACDGSFTQTNTPVPQACN